MPNMVTDQTVEQIIAMSNTVTDQTACLIDHMFILVVILMC